jgi:5-methyltetrahydrofolate--homocysteine methyltransferase
MVNLNEVSNAVIEGDEAATLELVKKALGEGIPARKVLDEGLIPGIHKVGDLFEAGEYFLPELLISGEAMSKAVEFLEPVLSKAGDTRSMGKFLIGTVQGDVHDIGKNITAMMLKANGWEVTDLGVDLSPQEFCSAVEKSDYDILGMSALLTMTMPAAAETIKALKGAGLRDKVKIMVGGAPTTQEWANEIGADGYAADAPSAVKVAAALVGEY